MNLNCDIVMDLVSLYNDGSVSQMTRKAIAEHLRKCPECRSFYKAYNEEMKREVSNSHSHFSQEEQVYNAIAAKVNRRRMNFITSLMLYSCMTVGALAWLLTKEGDKEAK